MRRLTPIASFALLALLVGAVGPAPDTYPRQPGIDAIHYAFDITLSDETDEIIVESVGWAFAGGRVA